ncbi:MAG: apolipoprotein N-acyltransferase [Bacteriovoracaceae bacterium]
MIVPFLFSLLAGILYAFGFPNFLGKGIFLLPTLSFGLLYFSWQKSPNLKAKALHLLILSLSFTLTGYYWITQTLVEFGDLPYVVAIFLNLLFFLIAFPQYWVFLLLEALIKEKAWFQTLKNKLPSGTKIISLAFLFSFLEYFVPQQFPGHLGHNWLQLTPFLGLAPIGGVPLFSFMSYLLVFTLIHYFNTSEKEWLLVGFLAIFLLINLLFPLQPFKEDHNTIALRVVQPNVGNFLKIESEKGEIGSVSNVLQSLHNLAITENGFEPDLIVFPETSYPYSIYSPRVKKDARYVPDLFQKIQSVKKASILVGGYDLKQENPSATDFYEQEYNSSFFFNAQSKLKDVYHKHLLIPFGETLPVGPFKSILAKVINNITYFAEGKEETKFELKPGINFITPICYEVLFPSFIRSMILSNEKPVHFLINLTNDSWYGKTAEIEQHLFLAKWRALEFGLPIVRSTNTGITSVIYPDGSESNRLPIYEKVVLDHQLKVPVYKKTLYLRYGFEVVALLSLVFFLFTYFLEKPSLNKS